MITRRILVTKLKKENGEEYELFGRYDAVAVASRGDSVIKAGFQVFHVKEEDFVKISKERAIK